MAPAPWVCSDLNLTPMSYHHKQHRRYLRQGFLGIDQNRAFALRTPRRFNGSGEACGGCIPTSRAVPSHCRLLSRVREGIHVRLEKYLLLGSAIRTLGGDTAVRRERSGVPHASPETPWGFSPRGVSAPCLLRVLAIVRR